MVVDGSAAARRALRRGGQLASALHGPLLALVVETPTSGRMAFDSARDLRENLDFATDLGAEVVRVEASDLVTGVTEVARHRRVTQLVLPHHESGGLGGFGRRSVADEVLRRMPELDVHLVAGPA